MNASLISEYLGQDEGESAGGGGPPVAADVPHLTISHNDIKADNGNLNKLLGSNKNSAEALVQEILAYGKGFGVERLAFLTITFAGKEAPTLKHVMKCFKSFLNSYLRRRYVAGVRVTERGGETGRLHFHLVIVMDEDVVTGYDFKRTDYKSENPTASPYFLREHEALKKALPKYGFGPIHWFEPVKKSLEALARYVGGYVSKNIANRVLDDKKARLWGCWGEVPRACSCEFARVGPNRWLWGQKAKIWAASHGFEVGPMAKDSFAVMDWLNASIGPRWAYQFQEEILAVDIKAHGLSYRWVYSEENGKMVTEHEGVSPSESEDIKLLNEIWYKRIAEFSNIADGFESAGRPMWKRGEMVNGVPQRDIKMHQYYWSKCHSKMLEMIARRKYSESTQGAKCRKEFEKDLREKAVKAMRLRGDKLSGLLDGLKAENQEAKRYDKIVSERLEDVKKIADELKGNMEKMKKSERLMQHVKNAMDSYIVGKMAIDLMRAYTLPRYVSNERLEPAIWIRGVCVQNSRKQRVSKEIEGPYPPFDFENGEWEKSERQRK